MYTVDGLSIGEITRRINAEGIPTRKASARWERSTVWAVLRNSAYRGVAYFGKTRASSRTRVIRPQRRRGVITPTMTAGHERPREEWIEIPVPALVREDSFARAQELLQENKIRSRRRTIDPSIVQGLVSCQKCGYAFARTSTRTSARKIHYYKCIGSDGWRKLGGPVCNNGRLVRQDLLDQIVWDEVIRLLEDPTLIQQELDRRLEAARSSNPTKKREQNLQRELAHVGKSIERLLSAYQEALMSIEQLRERMPTLRQREQTLRAELQAITDQANDRAAFLRLAETLTAFLARLHEAADTLSINERQRIVRLVVKDVLIGEDTITIRHSIPAPQGPSHDGCLPPNQTGGPNYLLCKGSHHPTLGNSLLSGRLQDFLQQPQHRCILDSSCHLRQQLIMPHIVEVGPQIKIDDAGLAAHNRLRHPDDRLMSCPFWPVAIGTRLKISFEDRLQDELQRTLNHAVANCGDREDADFIAPVLRDLLSPNRYGPIRVGDEFVPYLLQKHFHSAFFDGFERDSIHSGSPVVFLGHLVGFAKRFHLAHVDVQSPETPSWFSLRLDV
jgi:site-specific DNA recombinase